RGTWYFAEFYRPDFDYWKDKMGTVLSDDKMDYLHSVKSSVIINVDHDGYHVGGSVYENTDALRKNLINDALAEDPEFTTINITADGLKVAEEFLSQISENPSKELEGFMKLYGIKHLREILESGVFLMQDPVLANDGKTSRRESFEATAKLL